MRRVKVYVAKKNPILSLSSPYYWHCHTFLWFATLLTLAF
jgi:hypothetical protein